MNEHAGPACALSGLIVGLFAVLLHDNSPPPPAPKSQGRDVPAASPPAGGTPKPDAPPAIAPAPSNAIAAPKPLDEKAAVALPAVVAREVRVALAEPAKSPGPAARPRPAVANAPAGPSRKRSPPPSPRPSFAVVEPGESLADVAARVYGSEDAAEALWKANRDQVERVDSALARGTLLRTP